MSFYFSEPPIIRYEDSLLKQSLHVNEQWKLNVEVSGYPKPEVWWERNGQKLESDDHITIHIEENLSSTVAIYSTKREDSSTYTIYAKNSAQTEKVDFKLQVIGKLFIILKIIILINYILDIPNYILL